MEKMEDKEDSFDWPLEPPMDTDSSDITAGLFKKALHNLATKHLSIAGKLRKALFLLFHLQMSGALLSLSSSCSGTDICVPAFSNALEHLSSYAALPGQLHLIHSWSCEAQPFKQQWLWNVMGCEKIFVDIAELGSGHASCIERSTFSRSMSRVTSTLMHVAGFSCHDVSVMSKNAKASRKCIGGKSGSTGQTFDGVLRYCARFLPLLVLLENVKTLGRTNIESIVDKFKKIGYIIIYWVNDTFKHGLPARRPRVWFAAILCPTLAQDELLRKQLQDEAWELEQLMRVDPEPMSSFLVPTSSPHYARCEQNRRVRRRPDVLLTDLAKARKALQIRKWKAHQRKIWAKALGHDGPAPEPQAWVKSFGKEWGLPPREKAALHFATTHALSQPGLTWDSFVAINVSQSVYRMPVAYDSIPTITPAAQTLILRRPDMRPYDEQFPDRQHTKLGDLSDDHSLDLGMSSRPLFGYEMFSLQGMSFPPIKMEQILREFSDAQCADLAGNSFAGPACTFGLMVFLVVLGHLIPGDADDLESLRQQARDLVGQRPDTQAPGGSWEGVQTNNACYFLF